MTLAFGFWRTSVLSTVILTTGVLSALASPIVPVSAVSRKVHGSAGAFDVSLPLTGSPGVECRTSSSVGTYQLVVTFATSVTFITATVSSGVGTLDSASVSGGVVTVDLTGVASGQQ